MKKILFIFVLLSLGICSSFAQNTLNGTVVDKEGNPIPGVKVRARGQDGFVISNLDGTFHVDSRKPVKNVKLTCPGFKEEKYKVHSNMVIKMKRTNWWTERPGRQFFIGPQMGYELTGCEASYKYPSAGLIMGWGGIAKVYVKFMTNTFYSNYADFNFIPMGFDEENHFFYSGNENLYELYNSENKKKYDISIINSYMDCSFGGMIRLKCPIYLYAGCVYVSGGEFCDVKGNIFWADSHVDRYSEFVSEIGLMMTFRKVFINTGAIIGDGVRLNFGLGIML